MIPIKSSTLKGIWIPYQILTNEKLSDKEKYLYSLILFFSRQDGYCTITNRYLGSIVNLSDTRVSKLISKLAKQKYIQVITNFQDETIKVTIRKIIPLVIYDNPTELKPTTALVENDNSSSQIHTNTIVSNDKNINNNKYKKMKNSDRVYSMNFFDGLYANKF